MIEMQYEFVATFSINHLSLHIGIRVTNTVLFMVWVMFGNHEEGSGCRCVQNTGRVDGEREVL